MKQTALQFSSSILGFLIVLQLGLSLFLQLYILKLFGVGENTDTIIAALTIPTVLFSIFFTVFQGVYFPILATKYQNQKKWFYILGKAHGKIFLFYSVLALFFLLFADKVLSVMFFGFSATQIEVLEKLFILFYFSFWINTHNHLFAIALRTINKFIIAELFLLGGIFLNIILVMLFVTNDNILNLGVIYILSSLIIFGTLYLFLGKPKIIFKNIFNDKKFKMMLTLLKGNILYKSSPLIDRFLLSFSMNGGMSIYNLAVVFNGSFIKVIDKTLILMNLPQISILIKTKDYNKVMSIFNILTIRVIIVTLLILLTLGLLFPFWHDFINLFFAIELELSNILFLLMIILLGVFITSLLGSVINHIFYSLGDAKTPTKIGIYGFFMSIPIKVIGFIYFGLVGLAFATSIYYILNTLILYIRLKEKIYEK